MDLCHLVWTRLKEDNELKALYDSKHIDILNLCEESVKQGYEKLNNDDFLSEHDEFVLYKRIRVCLNDKDIDEGINSKGKSIINLVYELDNKITDANNFIPKALIVELKDEWLQLKNMVEESKEALCVAIDGYLAEKPSDNETWNVKSTHDKTERANFAIHVLIDELSNTGRRKILAYMKGEEIINLINYVYILEPRIDYQASRFPNNGNMVVLTKWMNERLDTEQALNKAIDTFMAENSILLGTEWKTICSENQRGTEALRRLYEYFISGTISASDYDTIIKPKEENLKQLRIFAVKRIKESLIEKRNNDFSLV